MKKYVKTLFLLDVIILLFLFINPTNANALGLESNLISIDNAQNLEVGDLFFSNISFKDYSSISTQAFGLSGIVKNDSESNITYTFDVEYYDSNKNLISKKKMTNTAISGTSNFNQMYNLDALGSYNVSDIYYYKLLVKIDDSIGSTVNNFAPSKDSNYDYFDFVIDKYDINIIVNENNTFDVTEKITAYFRKPKHGIVRLIPLKNKGIRLDGTSFVNHAQVTNLKINNKYKKLVKNGNYKLQIGSPDKTVVGEQKYVIKYKYNLGKDPEKTYDELYYNIVGGDFTTAVGNVTFSITMPKKFDSSKLGFSAGKKGSLENSKVEYNVSENKISGKYNGILDSGEALTIRCELPEGYFVGAKLKINIEDYILYLIPVIFLGISIFLWYKFGQDDKIVETVEFYPPDGLNSLEIGFLYKGKANSKDVVSLLIYLADKGYIKITEISNEESKFKIIKLKEYDGDNKNEDLFFKGLFKKKSLLPPILDDEDYSKDVKEVTIRDLYNRFYVTVNRILKNVNSKENKNKVFEKSSINKRIIVILMIIITYCLITIPSCLLYDDIVPTILALVFPIYGLLLPFRENFNENANSKFWGIISGLLFGVLPWGCIVLPNILQNEIDLIGCIIGLLCLTGMMFCLKYLPKRTIYGNEILGKLKGFKNFLETVEKDKLEALVLENPTYFYDILPYTYVLNISDKWIEKFKLISIQAPTWYDGYKEFNFKSFETFMKSTMETAQSVMSSNSSGSGSSGGSTGGGVSGGGSGGGGGSSW